MIFKTWAQAVVVFFLPMAANAGEVVSFPSRANMSCPALFAAQRSRYMDEIDALMGAHPAAELTEAERIAVTQAENQARLRERDQKLTDMGFSNYMRETLADDRSRADVSFWHLFGGGADILGRTYSPLVSNTDLSFVGLVQSASAPVTWLNSGFMSDLAKPELKIFENVTDNISELTMTSDSSQQMPSNLASPVRELTRWRADQTLSPALKSKVGEIDIITDVQGDATTQPDLGAVLANYHRLLKVGGHLLIRMPVSSSLFHFPFNRFVNASGNVIDPDFLFSRLPGFELVNSFTQEEVFVKSSTQPRMSRGPGSNLYGNRAKFGVFMLRKTGADEIHLPLRVRLNGRDDGRTTRTLILTDHIGRAPERPVSD